MLSFGTLWKNPGLWGPFCVYRWYWCFRCLIVCLSSPLSAVKEEHGCLLQEPLSHTVGPTQCSHLETRHLLCLWHYTSTNSSILRSHCLFGNCVTLLARVYLKVWRIINLPFHFHESESPSVVSDSLGPHGLQHSQASLPITNCQSLLKLMSIMLLKSELGNS